MNYKNAFYLFLALILTWYFFFFSNRLVSPGWDNIFGNPHGNDFSPFYHGAKLLLKDPHHLYEISAQKEIQSAAMEKFGLWFMYFINPPFVAVAFLPYLLLPLEVAYKFWVLFNVILMGLIVIGIYIFLDRSWWIKSTCAIGFLLFPALIYNFAAGQLSRILALALLAAWVLYKRNKPGLSGALLALSSWSKPQYIAVPIVISLLRPKKLLLGFGIATLLLLLVTVVAIGQDGPIKYLNFLAESFMWVDDYTKGTSFQFTLIALAGILTNVWIGRLLWFFTALAVGLGTTYAWLFTFKNSDFATNLQWGIAVISLLIITPHLHFYDIIYVYIAAIIVLDHKSTLLPSVKRMNIFLLCIMPIYYLFGNLYLINQVVLTIANLFFWSALMSEFLYVKKVTPHTLAWYNRPVLKR